MMEQELKQASPTVAPLVQEGKKPSNKIVTSFLVMFISLLLGWTIYGITTKMYHPIQAFNTITSSSPTSYLYPSSAQLPSSEQILLSGRVTRLSQDLGLFTNLQPDAHITYYEAGTYLTGTYNKYKRIVAIGEAFGPGNPPVYIFATKDNVSYIFDEDPTNLTYTNDTWRNPYGGTVFNKEKVTSVAILPTDYPDIVTLNNIFALYKQAILTERNDTRKKDTYGYTIYENILVTDVSTLIALPSNIPHLKLYAIPNQKTNLLPNLTDQDKKYEETRQAYLSTTTQIIAIDETGLAISYSLTTNDQASSYSEKLKAYNTALEKAKKNPANYPTYPSSPNLRFMQTDIKNTTTNDLYETYDSAVPHVCGIGIDIPVVNNISENDLQKIGTEKGIDLYTLTNLTHPLYGLAYNNKMQSFSDNDSFKQLNHADKPTLEQYVAKHPLLFLKDYWNRWVMLGEYDYKLPGGCGKPVIYLYPTKPTAVQIHFINPMQLDTNIPSYHEGWNVLAQPNGLLQDLQPQFTDCAKIDITKKGSEYAQQSCSTNNYPYLYWSGNSFQNTYPEITDGWVVSKNNLEQFMSQTLDDIGFTNTEKTDMLSYWLPKMREKNTPFYRIAFLQTADMNKLAPMSITPQPDTVYRLFLDFLPLKSKPKTILLPQHLLKVERKGFTLVEWGGLLR